MLYRWDFSIVRQVHHFSLISNNFGLPSAFYQEELQIEANVVGEKGNLVSVVIDIKKKSDGEKVVIGKQWMHVIPFKKSQAGKSKL